MTTHQPLIELEAGPVAAGGGCVARTADGRVVFVRHCLPGERVMASITEERKSYLRADAVEILVASPDRVRPPCPYAGPGLCGGCDWQHARLPAQRALKAALVTEQLRRLAGIVREVEVEEIPGAPDGLSWRTQVRFSVDEVGRVGLRKYRSHDVQVVERCLIAAVRVEAAGVETKRWPGVQEIEVFSPDESECLVSVTTRAKKSKPLPFVEAGLVVNGRAARPPERLVTEVLGRHYELSAGVFWQVHVGAARTLGRVVLDSLGARRGDRVADLYAGAGLFTALVGGIVGPSGSVLGVERDRRAWLDAKRNTADLPSVEVMRAAVTPGLVARLGDIDLVVLDPSREGAGQAVMASLVELQPGPRRIVYVSCDPASFARDVRVLLDAGWTLQSLRAFDLFPMTSHVEVVAVIEPPQVRLATYVFPGPLTPAQSPGQADRVRGRPGAGDAQSNPSTHFERATQV